MTLLVTTTHIAGSVFSHSTDLLKTSPESMSSVDLSKDFVAKMIDIIKESAAEKNFDHMDVQLAERVKSDFQDSLTPEIIHIFVQRIKETDAFADDLPIIYRHLIYALQLNKRYGDSLTIPDFTSFTEEFRIECAKFFIDNNQYTFCADLQKCAIKNREVLIEILKIAAKKSGVEVSRHIASFGIADQEILIEIAKLAAQQDGTGASYHIRNYGIIDQAARVDIAKLVAQQQWADISDYIANYDIRDQTALIEIAKIVAQRDGVQTSRNIANYGIKDETARIEIAKIVAQRDGALISKHIANYGITNQTAHIEIAKLAVQQDAEAVLKYIANYGITDQTVHVEIAKIVAQQNGETVLKYIANYGITDQAALIEIAKFAAQQKDEVSPFIAYYGIKDEAARVEIAKIAAQKNGWSTSYAIGNYCIKDETARIEIAKIAAQQNGKDTSEFIHNYGIKNEKNRFEIACIAMRQMNEKAFTALWLNRYNLSLEYRVRLFAYAINVSSQFAQKIDIFFPDKVAALKQYPELRAFGLSDNFNIRQFLLDFWEEENVDFSLISKPKLQYAEMQAEKDLILKAEKMRWLAFYCAVLDFARDSKPLLKELTVLLDTLDEELNPYVKEQKMHAIAALILNCHVHNVITAVLDHLPLFKILLELRDPALRLSLVRYFVNILLDPAKAEKFSAPKLEALHLVSLLLTNHLDKILSSVEGGKQISFQQRIEKFLKHKYFEKERIKSLLRSLYVLMETTQLKDEDKTRILKDLIFVQDPRLKPRDQSEQLLRCAQIVAQLIEYRESDRLTKILNPQELQKQVEVVFSEALHLSEIPDFNKKFSDTLGQWRNPSALLTYAAKMQTLPPLEKELILPHLKQYAESVLNKTFTATRYYVGFGASEHMRELHKKAPKLLEAWQKGGYASRIGEYIVEDTDDPCDLLLCGTEVSSCQRVDGDPDKCKCLLAYLLDGKIRMMAVKNKKGVIVARCILRLLWNPSTEKFVLFQEKTYPEISDTFSQPLRDACMERAQQLSVSLFVKKESTEDAQTLQAFKGTLPFEYVDALSGTQSNTGYVLKDSTCVFAV